MRGEQHRDRVGFAGRRAPREVGEHLVQDQVLGFGHVGRRRGFRYLDLDLGGEPVPGLLVIPVSLQDAAVRPQDRCREDAFQLRQRAPLARMTRSRQWNVSVASSGPRCWSPFPSKPRRKGRRLLIPAVSLGPQRSGRGADIAVVVQQREGSERVVAGVRIERRGAGGEHVQLRVQALVLGIPDRCRRAGVLARPPDVVLALIRPVVLGPEVTQPCASMKSRKPSRPSTRL